MLKIVLSMLLMASQPKLRVKYINETEWESKPHIHQTNKFCKYLNLFCNDDIAPKRP